MDEEDPTVREMLDTREPVDVYVVLKCDFVLDEDGRAVDGNHRRGGLARGYPTGDGVEGGTFESWFRLQAKPGERK
jgi:hypothetical protein